MTPNSSLMATTRKNVCPLPKCVCVWWKMIGLCPFIFVEKKMIQVSGARCAYTMALIIAYVILYCRAILNRLEFMLPHETLMTVVADFFGLSVECLMVISSWLYIIFRQSELKRMLKMFENVSASLELIGISQSGEKIFRSLKIQVIVVNVIWIGLFCCDHAMLMNNKSFRYDVWLPFNFPRIVSHNVVIMFLNSLFIMKKYFYLLNRKMHTLPEILTFKPILLRRRLKSSQHHGLVSHVMPSPLEVYGQIHSDLVTFTKVIVKFFSLSILLVLLVHLVQMASDLYILCMMVRLQRFWTRREVVAFGVLSSWFISHFTQTLALLGIPDSTVDEANRAGKMLHKMLAADDTQKYADTGQILSLRLLQRRLTISLWGLFQMKLSIVHTIVGTVGTYLTVMMQLDAQGLREKMLNETIVQSLRT